MWTSDTRAEHDPDDLRYPGDLADAEWQMLAPLLLPHAETDPTALGRCAS